MNRIFYLDQDKHTAGFNTRLSHLPPDHQPPPAWFSKHSGHRPRTPYHPENNQGSHSDPLGEKHNEQRQKFVAEPDLDQFVRSLRILNTSMMHRREWTIFNGLTKWKYRQTRTVQARDTRIGPRQCCVVRSRLVYNHSPERQVPHLGLLFRSIRALCYSAYLADSRGSLLNNFVFITLLLRSSLIRVTHSVTSFTSCIPETLSRSATLLPHVYYAVSHTV